MSAGTVQNVRRHRCYFCVNTTRYIFSTLNGTLRTICHVVLFGLIGFRECSRVRFACFSLWSRCPILTQMGDYHFFNNMIFLMWGTITISPFSGLNHCILL
jgi:hypothetical protein